MKIKKHWLFWILLLPVFTIAQNHLDSNNSDSALTSSSYDTDLLSPSFFQGNRTALRAKMPPNSVAIFFSAPTRIHSNDVYYPYQQSPNFYYLSGCNEPNAILLIFKDKKKFDSVVTNEILFVQPIDSNKEKWTGKRLGVKGAASISGIKTVFEDTQLTDFDINFSHFNKVMICGWPKGMVNDTHNDGDLFSLCNYLKQKADFEKITFDDYLLNSIMANLRSEKQFSELVLMRKAVLISCEAQKALMHSLKSGMKEYQAQAIIEYVFKSNGAEMPGFPTIEGSGENSCILHYNTNRKTIDKSDLLVSDVGAEYHGYVADVTRTLPANGTFSTEQKIIYNIVFKAQEAAIKACISGNKFWDPHLAATTVITNHLMKLGIIKKKSEVTKYFFHNTSHYVGLDVHDVGPHENLEPGQVITVEPGIYIPKGSPCDPKWWNIGIRIGDEVLITEDKPNVLSSCLPKSIKNIEGEMKKPSEIFK